MLCSFKCKDLLLFVIYHESLGFGHKKQVEDIPLGHFIHLGIKKELESRLTGNDYNS